MVSTVDRYVLVGVDGSESALRAVRWAADVAARRRVKLLIATGHTGNDLELVYGGSPSAYVAAVIDATRTVLDDALAVARAGHPGLEVQVETLRGGAVSVLAELSEHALLTVIGATGRGGFANMLTGSVAMSTVARARGPVAVVRADGAGRLPERGPVLLAMDGTPAGEAAIGAAFEEAAQRRVGLTAVHVWSTDLPDVPLAYQQAAGVDVEDGLARRRELIAERLAGWREKYPDVPVRRVITGGHVVERLLAEAADAQLIVVGSHGHGDLVGAFVGSVSRALVGHAACPVLVARPAAPGSGG